MSKYKENIQKIDVGSSIFGKNHYFFTTVCTKCAFVRIGSIFFPLDSTLHFFVRLLVIVKRNFAYKDFKFDESQTRPDDLEL